MGDHLTLEQVAEWVEFCRLNGIRRLRTADIEFDLADREPAQEPLPAPEKLPAEEINRATGLTPSQEREWFEA